MRCLVFSLVHGLLDEHLDRPLAPRTERAATESSGEPLHAGEPHPLDLDRVPIEQVDAGIGEDARDFLGLIRLEVVVPEHRHDRDLHACREVACEHARLFRQPVIGEVAGYDQNIRPLADLAEERLEHPLGLLAVVHVAHGGDSNCVARRHMARVVGRPSIQRDSGQRRREYLSR
jgi:hypothetical protein